MAKLSISAQLLMANKALEVQNEEKEQRAAELILANIELSFQNKEKEDRAAELILANIELSFQNKEKEDRAAELILANIELSYQHEEKAKRAAELVIANHELILQSEEKGKRADELMSAYKELRKVEEHMKGHILGLEEMMFITSHKVRKPVANILGLSNLLDDFMQSPARLRKLVDYLKLSAQELDDFTKELTEYMSKMEKHGKS
jgi:signal transduction histidine kinase